MEKIEEERKIVSVVGQKDGTIIVTTQNGEFTYTDNELASLYLILSDHLGFKGRLKLWVQKKKYGEFTKGH